MLSDFGFGFFSISLTPANAKQGLDFPALFDPTSSLLGVAEGVF